MGVRIEEMVLISGPDGHRRARLSYYSESLPAKRAEAGQRRVDKEVELLGFVQWIAKYVQLTLVHSLFVLSRRVSLFVPRTRRWALIAICSKMQLLDI